MKRRYLAILFCVVLLGADSPPDDAKKEPDKLQGTWKAVAIEENGKAVPADVLNQFRLIVTGDKWRMRTRVKDEFKDVDYKARFDAKKEPHALDLTTSNFTAKPDIVQGIYRLEGDVLKLRLSPPGKDRPAGFDGKADDGSTVLVLQRDRS